MEPDSEAKGTDLVGTETSDDEVAEPIRWIGDARHPGHHTVEDHPNGDDEAGIDSIPADSNGNGAAASAEQLELDGSTTHGDGRSGSHDLEAWDDDEEWDDEDWDDEDAVACDWGADAAEYTQHLTLAEVLRVRSARIIGIVAVVTIFAVLMATVLLWQRVEGTRAEVDRGRQVASVPGLASVHRRLNRLETEIAAILGSPNGDPAGRADAIQKQLTALNQCVSDFQHTVVSGKRSAVRYC